MIEVTLEREREGGRDEEVEEEEGGDMKWKRGSPTYHKIENERMIGQHDGKKPYIGKGECERGTGRER